MNRGDLAELISNKWDQLDKATRDKYAETLKNRKESYQKDITEFQSKYGKVERKEYKP